MSTNTKSAGVSIRTALVFYTLPLGDAQVHNVYRSQSRAAHDAQLSGQPTAQRKQQWLLMCLMPSPFSRDFPYTGLLASSLLEPWVLPLVSSSRSQRFMMYGNRRASGAYMALLMVAQKCHRMTGQKRTRDAHLHERPVEGCRGLCILRGMSWDRQRLPGASGVRCSTRGTDRDTCVLSGTRNICNYGITRR